MGGCIGGVKNDTKKSDIIYACSLTLVFRIMDGTCTLIGFKKISTLYVQNTRSLINGYTCLSFSNQNNHVTTGARGKEA